MIAIANVIVEIGMFFLLFAMVYAIIQVVEVIREERERLAWYRRPRPSDLRDEDDYIDPRNPNQ